MRIEIFFFFILKNKSSCYNLNWIGGNMYIDVLVEVMAGKDQTFTYKTDSHVNPGMRVLVPFGRQILEGFVLRENLNKAFDYEVKKIIKVIV